MVLDGQLSTMTDVRHPLQDHRQIPSPTSTYEFAAIYQADLIFHKVELLLQENKSIHSVFSDIYVQKGLNQVHINSNEQWKFLEIG